MAPSEGPIDRVFVVTWLMGFDFCFFFQRSESRQTKIHVRSVDASQVQKKFNKVTRPCWAVPSFLPGFSLPRTRPVLT